METVKISELKMDCYSILKKVEQTKEGILITRKGKAIAKIIPSSSNGSWLGSMASTGEIVGDIVSPVVEAGEWEVLKE